MRQLAIILFVVGAFALPGVASVAEARWAASSETQANLTVFHDKTIIPKAWGRLVAVLPYQILVRGSTTEFAKLIFVDDQGIIRMVHYSLDYGLSGPGEQGAVIQIDRE